MSEQRPKPKTPISNLEELRKIIDSAEEIIVDSSGSIHRRQDEEVANTPPQNRTRLKPQRWFAQP